MGGDALAGLEEEVVEEELLVERSNPPPPPLPPVPVPLLLCLWPLSSIVWPPPPPPPVTSFHSCCNSAGLRPAGKKNQGESRKLLNMRQLRRLDKITCSEILLYFLFLFFSQAALHERTP